MKNTQEPLRVAIVGATGYTGSELLRILWQHPFVEITAVTSERHAGKDISSIHPHFRNIIPYELTHADALHPEETDIVFLALPHGVSMDYVQKLSDKHCRIIDLSGDYRLSSPEVYQEWYGKSHVHPEGFPDAVYGLLELYRDRIVSSRLTANPGCYPTCSILATLPLLEAGLIDPTRIIIDAKSGTTGAGISPNAVTHFSNVSDNFRAYGLKTHRHTIEIEEQLRTLGAATDSVLFTPHLLPVDRGILATIYSQPRKSITEKDLREVYHARYADEPFVRMRDMPPTLKDVRGSNYCDIHVTYDGRTGQIIALATIDNLVKGAAGQAVQNMNCMLGLPEDTGLSHIPMHP
ncbi:MAG: N-acetyl-gamma-glutamyl-phosphate reductase [Bacteroidetes bacterium]|nr:N-acetyl-gamma-glutamyl-phosphate reductase [Bacteroidota bacterium]